MNATTETLEAYVRDTAREDPADVEDEDEVVITNLAFFRTNSPAARVVDLQQIPSSDSSSVTAMTTFSAILHEQLQILIAKAPEPRSLGMISNCEVHQYALNHIVKFTNIQWRERREDSIIMSLGNSSGLMTKLLIQHYHLSTIIHLSIDTVETVDGLRQVTSMRSNAIPPELVDSLNAKNTRNRLVMIHGPDGNLQSNTAIQHLSQQPVLYEVPVRAVYLSLMEVNPKDQKGVISRIVKLILSLNAAGSVLIVIWRVNSIDITSLYLTLSLGTRSSIEVIGPEYLSTPVFQVAIHIASQRAMMAPRLAIPLSLQAAIQVCVQKSQLVGVETPHTAASITKDRILLSLNTNLASILLIPRMDSLLTDACVCSIHVIIGPRLLQNTRRDLEQFCLGLHSRVKARDEVIVELESLGLLFQYAGVACTLLHSVVESCYDDILDEFRSLLYIVIRDVGVIPPGLVLLQGSSFTTRTFTPSGHKLTATPDSLVIQAYNIKLDLLRRFNLGVMAGYELLLIQRTFLTTNPNEADLLTEKLTMFSSSINIDQCCSATSPIEARNNLTSSEINLANWSRQLLINQGLVNIRPDPHAHQRRDLASPDRHAPDMSPEYFPESPELRGD